MKLKSAIVFLVVAVLFTVVNLFLGLYERQIRYSPPGRAIRLSPDALTGVDIYRGAETLAHCRFDAGRKYWTLSAPQAGIRKATLDHTVGDAFLNFLLRAECRPAKVSLAEAGLQDLQAVLQIAYYAGSDNASVYLGNKTSDGMERYFVLDTAPDRVLVAPDGLFREFFRAPAQMRTRDVFNLADKTPDTIIWETAGRKDVAVSAKTATGNSARERVVIRQSSEGWVLAEPCVWPAENELVGGMLQGFMLLRADDFCERLPESAEPFATLTLKNSGRSQQATFYREPQSRRAFAVRAERSEVYIIDSAGLEPLLRPALAETLRRKTLDLLPARQLGKIVINNSESGVCEMRAGERGWSASGTRQFAVDGDAVKRLLLTLHNFQLLRVVAEKFSPELLPAKALNTRIQTFDTAGAAAGEVTVWAAMRESQPHYYATVAGRTQLLEIHPLTGMALLQPFLAYRDRSLLHIDFSAIRQLRIVRCIDNNRELVFSRVNDTQFKQLKPQPKELGERASWEFIEMLRQLALLRCEGYLVAKKDNLAVYGLDRPLLISILSMGKDDNPASADKVTLTVGRTLTLGGNVKYYAAMLDNDDYIFVLRDKFVERLLANY